MIFRILLLFSILSFHSCKCQKNNSTPKENNQVELLQEKDLKIQEIYYQSWVAGIQGGGSGITIYIDLKQALSNDLKFVKAQIKTLGTTSIEKIDDLHYVAHIKTHANDLKLEEDPKKEYGNEVPTKSDINLKEGQIKLFFTKNDKNFYKLIEDVKEKPMIAYPSTKPQNNDE